jgi:hypothetical protein
MGRGRESPPRLCEVRLAFVCRLLGLAIAHEIGHVLLNGSSPAASGPLRADWPRADLRRAEGRRGRSSKPKPSACGQRL